MSKAAHLPAADVRIGDLITRYDGTGYRVREVTPSASGKVIRFNTLVEVATPGGPELGRRFNLIHRAGTMLLVERDAPLQLAAGLITVTLDDEGTLASRMTDRFQWMLELSPEDQATCAQDLVDAARASLATEQPHLVIAELTAWRETATAIAAGFSSDPIELNEGIRPVERP
ncbi:hypothetical protein [Microterricola viridarii]|uniref:Uncharacterized protein n=1 Tax=Microterricola viridarii TaxID=412690 RepID=A0A1H1T458_9MICO|nr:hypothetical protein [Microterricola viridarii]SDS54806.1 hypothetical protein SAMN04489834_1683 [Microterricola viridarii]